MIWCSAHSTRIYIHDRDIKSQHETKLHLFASEQALLNLNADLISSESGMAGGVDQRTGAPLAPALHCRSAPAPIRNRKRPVADSGAVRNTMGRRVSTFPRTTRAGPLARTYASCLTKKTRQRVTRPHGSGRHGHAVAARHRPVRGSERSTGAVRHRPRAPCNGRRRHCPRATRRRSRTAPVVSLSFRAPPGRDETNDRTARGGRHRLGRFRGRSRLHARHDYTCSFLLHVLAG